MMKPNNGSPPTILKANEPTGEKPMELFITDEHTPYYLSLKTSDESNLGTASGLLLLTIAIPSITIASLHAIMGEWEHAWAPLIVGITIFPISFFWESRKPIPLPIIFNHRTKEIYFDHNGKLFHTPWNEIQSLTYEFKVFSPHIGSLNNAALEIMVRRLGEPENALSVSLGPPMGKNLTMQKSFWEYIRSYMNNGPWFDEHGNHSDSDAFVKEQLSTNIRSSDFLAHQYQAMKDKKTAGKSYLTLTDIYALILDLILHPANLIEELVYKTAKRRARNRWPEIVLERLRPDGPTTRLIDLERERGLKV